MGLINMTNRKNFFDRPSYLEIDLSAVAENTHNIKDILPEGTDLQAVVKSNAYGHGAVEVSKVMAENGADCFGVAFIEEGIELRQSGIKQPIVLLYPETASRAPLFVEYNLTPTISDLEFTKALNNAAWNTDKVDVYIKVDTGMSRYGIKGEDVRSFTRELLKMRKIHIAGFSTNFSTSDNGDLSFCYEQIHRFEKAVDSVKKDLGSDLVLSMANSGGLLNLPESYFNMVRVGLLIYGYYPSSSSRRIVSVRPALKLISRILHLEEMEKGTPIGYGMSYITHRRTRVATIPIGYGDGYRRCLSNKGEVLVRGRRSPIIGRICMDALMVDVSEIDDVKVGDEVILIGNQGNEFIGADEIAEICGTIPWEITCSFTPRLPIVYKYADVHNQVVKV